VRKEITRETALRPVQNGVTAAKHRYGRENASSIEAKLSSFCGRLNANSSFNLLLSFKITILFFRLFYFFAVVYLVLLLCGYCMCLCSRLKKESNWAQWNNLTRWPIFNISFLFSFGLVAQLLFFFFLIMRLNCYLFLFILFLYIVFLFNVYDMSSYYESKKMIWVVIN
jgi:hypothetical protein